MIALSRKGSKYFEKNKGEGFQLREKYAMRLVSFIPAVSWLMLVPR